MTTSNEELALKIVHKIELLQSEIADREEAVENYKSKLDELLGDAQGEVIGNPNDGFYEYSSYLGKQFNAKQAEQVLPHERWLAASKATRTTTSAQAQKVLTDKEFALCQKQNSKKTIVIKRVDNDD